MFLSSKPEVQCGLGKGMRREDRGQVTFGVLAERR